ncbi:MAG: site-2 protease family protein [Candidatus Eiseniibacteriota bacterium]
MQDFGDTLLYLVALVFSVVFHEVSHGWVADRHGDPTARMMGRLTLNPVPHLDLWGSILLPGLLVLMNAPFLFGYAKPVPVDVRNLRNPRIDGLKVALVGPFSNLLLAFLCSIAFGLAIGYLGGDNAITRLFRYGLLVNCMLAIFNLLPVPPLDGSWILDHTLRGQAYETYRSLKPYGMLLLIGILLFPPVSHVLIRMPVNFVLSGFAQVSEAVARLVT